MKFTAQDVERHLGTTTRDLANWRSRGLLEGYGNVEANGRYSYTAEEIVAFYLAQVIQSGSVAWGEALRIAREHAPALVAALRGEEAGNLPRWLLYAFHGDGTHKAVAITKPEELTQADFLTAHIVDLAGLAKHAHKALRLLVQMED